VIDARILFALGCLVEMKRRLDQQTDARSREYDALCRVRSGWVSEVARLRSLLRLGKR